MREKQLAVCDRDDQYLDMLQAYLLKKKPAGCNYRNEKTVNAHFIKAFYIFSDKAVVVYYCAEHFPKLL